MSYKIKYRECKELLRKFEDLCSELNTDNKTLKREIEELHTEKRQTEKALCKLQKENYLLRERETLLRESLKKKRRKR